MWTTSIPEVYPNHCLFIREIFPDQYLCRRKVHSIVLIVCPIGLQHGSFSQSSLIYGRLYPLICSHFSLHFFRHRPVWFIFLHTQATQRFIKAMNPVHTHPSFGRNVTKGYIFMCPNFQSTNFRYQLVWSLNPCDWSLFNSFVFRNEPSLPFTSLLAFTADTFQMLVPLLSHWSFIPHS